MPSPGENDDCRTLPRGLHRPGVWLARCRGSSGAHALSGTVSVGGIPVDGAIVGLVKLGGQSPVSPGPADLIASTVTERNSAYRFDRVENVSFSGALVSVSRPMFFTETKYVQMSEDRRLDFALERAVAIAVGEVVRCQVGDARCASGGYGGMGSCLSAICLACS